MNPLLFLQMDLRVSLWSTASERELEVAIMVVARLQGQ